MESAQCLEGDDLALTSKDEVLSCENGILEDGLREQLLKVEEEIITLEEVLNSKRQLAADLKRQLSITVNTDTKVDFLQSIASIEDSDKHKTKSDLIQNITESTGNTLNSASENLSSKIDLIRNSDTFKLVESKIESVVVSTKKEKLTYNPGDRIFAKVKGFTMWPSRVNPLPEDIAVPPNKIPIFFFGTHEVFFIQSTSCFPYNEQNKIRYGKPRSRAHFNQGMNELENNPTLYQYGADPNAEDFLGQFYKFRRSNGEMTPGTKTDVKVLFDDDSKSTKSRKSVGKVRHPSGSSFSTKSSKINDGVKFQTDETEINEEVKIDGTTTISNSEKEDTCKMRRKSGSVGVEGKKMCADVEEGTDVAKVENEIVNVTVRHTRNRSGSSNVPTVVETLQVNEINVTETNDKIEMTVNVIEELKVNNAKSRKGRKNLKRSHSVLNAIDDKIVKEQLKGDVTVKDGDDSENVPKLRSRTKSRSGDRPISVQDDNQMSNAVIEDKISPEIVPIKNEIENEFKIEIGDNERPNLRSRSISASKVPLTRKSSTTKSEKKSDEGISTDSLKTKEVSVKNRKSRKSDVKSKLGSKGKKPKKKLSESDTLSSLSSDDDLMERDKERKEQFKETKDVKSSIKPSNRQIQKRSNSLSNVNEDGKVSVDAMPADDLEKSDEKEISQNESFMGKEVIVEISIPDIVKGDKTLFDYNKSYPESVEKFEIEFPIDKLNAGDDKDTGKDTLMDKKCNEDRTNGHKLTAEVVFTQRGSLPKKSKTINNRKRRRITSPRSEEEADNSGKKRRKVSSSSIESDSDIEMVAVHVPVNKSITSPMSVKKLCPDENTSAEAKAERIKALQTFNSDIRSSLVLGHEDYGKCLDRFKSLCTMSLDLISLVSVWQLMDTVKKCRRYKRNESVMAEAQNVYKRFMKIYSQSSPDEVHKAQIVLSQSRINGSQSSSIPNSVDEIFHPNRASTTPQVGPNNTTTTTITTNGSSANEHKKTVVSDSADEKMRLLSADLEAKVSDILNKIEKNTNPINIGSTNHNNKSLSHLLPSRTEQWILELPDKWESVNDDTWKNNNKRKVNNDAEDEDDDDDDDDMDAIVKRIENVPINQIEVVEEEEEEEVVVEQSSGVSHAHHHHHHNRPTVNVPVEDNAPTGIAGLTSALDARIANIFNTNFKDTPLPVNRGNSSNTKRRQSQPLSSRSHSHRPHQSAPTKHNPVSTKISTAVTLSPPHKSTSARISTVKETPLLAVNKTPVSPSDTGDNSIYDLLGV